jgi:hypothetical protein
MAAQSEYYKRIQGWFNFADLYSYQVSIANDGDQFVEIGAWLGKSTCYMASMIAQSRKKIRFYTVDTWDLGTIDPSYTRWHQYSPFSLLYDGLYMEFIDNLISSGLADYVVPMRSKSTIAAAQFDDNSLAFVFVDANHSYEGVTSDLHAWYPKIIPGGTIAGHDYVASPGNNLGAHPDVAKAVDTFFAAAPFSLLTSLNCWLFRKPPRLC